VPARLELSQQPILQDRPLRVLVPAHDVGRVVERLHDNLAFQRQGRVESEFPLALQNGKHE